MTDTAETLRQEWKRVQRYGPEQYMAATLSLVERALAALEAKEAENDRLRHAVDFTLEAENFADELIKVKAQVAKLRAALERAERTFRSYDMAQSADEVAAVLKETKQC